MRTSYAVLLNGPPGIGKDTLADKIVELTSIKKMEYKEGLRKATAKFFNVELSIANTLFADRILKEVPTPIFKGKTPRNALIHTDTYLKQLHGKSMVGKWAAASVTKEIKKGKKAFIFSDSGFEPEAEMVAECVDLIIVVQLHHPDFNFDNDSRDYVNVDLKNSVTLKFRRLDGEIDSDTSRLIGLVSDILWENRN